MTDLSIQTHKGRATLPLGGWPGPCESLAHAWILIRSCLVCSFGHLDEVESELRLHGSVNHAHFLGKDDILEFRDHFPPAEFSQITAPSA